MFIKNLFIVFSVLVIAACEPKELPKFPSDHLTYKNDVAYIELNKPFTGISYKNWKKGNLREMITYKNGLRHGLYESYFSNGQLQVKVMYQRGKFNGPLEEYYKNGQLKVKTSFLGKYNDGDIKDCLKWGIHYWCDLDLIGPYLEYGENGNLKRKATFAEVVNQTGKVGFDTEFYSNGRGIMSENHYAIVHKYSKKGPKFSVMHGPQKSWYANGSVYVIRTYNYGDLDGVQQEYDREGRLLEQGYYDLGVRCGPYEKYQNYYGDLQLVKKEKYGNCEENPTKRDVEVYPVDQQ